MTDRVTAHVEASNRAVRSGSWARFSERFGDADTDGKTDIDDGSDPESQ